MYLDKYSLVLKDYGYKPCVMQITNPLYNYAYNYFEWDGNEKEKPREFFQKLGIEIIRDKMNKIEEATKEKSSAMETLRNIQQEKEENEEKTKAEQQIKLSEIKATISKNEMMYKENTENLKEDIQRASSELQNLKDSAELAENKLEEMKSQISNDKTEYDDYIKMLEENNKKLLNQYEESVKENSDLRSKQEQDILKI